MPATSGPAVNARALSERIGGEWRFEPAREGAADDEASVASMPLLRDWTAGYAAHEEEPEDD